MSDLAIWTKLLAIKRTFIKCFKGTNTYKKKPAVGIHVAYMTTYQQILVILDNFEIIFIGALFGPGTAVVLCLHPCGREASCPTPLIWLC